MSTTTTRTARTGLRRDSGRTALLFTSVGSGVLSRLSSFDGQNDLHFGSDMAVTAAFSLAIYFFALIRRLPDEIARERAPVPR
jgi:hypothetical protein